MVSQTGVLHKGATALPLSPSLSDLCSPCPTLPVWVSVPRPPEGAGLSLSHPAQFPGHCGARSQSPLPQYSCTDLGSPCAPGYNTAGHTAGAQCTSKASER